MTFEFKFKVQNRRTMPKSLYEKIKAQGGNPIEAICNHIQKMGAKGKKSKSKSDKK